MNRTVVLLMLLAIQGTALAGQFPSDEKRAENPECEREVGGWLASADQQKAWAKVRADSKFAELWNGLRGCKPSDAKCLKRFAHQCFSQDDFSRVKEGQLKKFIKEWLPAYLDGSKTPNISGDGSRLSFEWIGGAIGVDRSGKQWKLSFLDPSLE